MATVPDMIRQRFDDNLDRVRNLVNVYAASAGTGQGRRTVQDADILRVLSNF
jgi:hypothetical protein